MTTLADLATGALLGGTLLACAWLVDLTLRRRAAARVLTLVWVVALLRLVLPHELASPASVTAGLGASSRAAARTLGDAPEWLFVVWLTGTAALLTLRVVRRFRLHSSLGTPAQLAPDWSDALANAAKLAGLRRLPSVHAVALSSPAVTSLWRPKLPLPASALERAPTRAFLSSRALLLRRLDALERPAPSPLARRVALALTLAGAVVALPMATPRGLDREHAHATLADARKGAPWSCFHLQASALVLAADSLPHEGTP